MVKKVEMNKRKDKVCLHVVSRNRNNICYGISRDPAFWNLGNPRNSVAHLAGHAVKCQFSAR
jgi:hypothetical protein